MAESEKVSITYLYSEVMAYAISVMRELVSTFDVNVHCVHWDKKKNTPFIPENEKGISFYKRSEYNEASLIKLIEAQNPSIIYISGTMDKLYLKAALHFRKKGVKLVAGSDNKWFNTWKQKVQAVLSYPLFRRYFEYIWIAGMRQYAFARLMGYQDDKIIKNLYSANTPVFMNAYNNNREFKKDQFPHTFVYVGRFSPVKGIDVMYKAFMEAKKEVTNDWKLVMVGAMGNSEYKPSKFVEIIEFIPNSELAGRTRDWGIFCLPSYQENWGVVLHEFAASGLPLICSDCVGASEAFIISGYNGFTFITGSWQDLKKKLLFMMSKTEEELFTMGERSNGLSQCINPTISAYSLMSVLDKEKGENEMRCFIT